MSAHPEPVEGPELVEGSERTAVAFPALQSIAAPRVKLLRLPYALDFSTSLEMTGAGNPTPAVSTLNASTSSARTGWMMSAHPELVEGSEPAAVAFPALQSIAAPRAKLLRLPYALDFSTSLEMTGAGNPAPTVSPFMLRQAQHERGGRCPLTLSLSKGLSGRRLPSPPCKASLRRGRNCSVCPMPWISRLRSK